MISTLSHIVTCSRIKLSLEMSVKLSIENVDEWLNSEIFVKVIENYLEICEEEFQFISISSTPATKAGDNYLSILLRSKVEIELKSGERKKLSFIVKCFLSSVYDETFVKELEVFSKEKKMYSEILPAFERLYKDVDIEMKFGPKCYFVASKPTDLIIMEDLWNYKMGERTLGLDENQVKLGLEWMAKFHAASMVYREQNGEYGNEFKIGLFRDSIAEQYESYFNAYFDHYLTALKSLRNGHVYAEVAECWRGQVYTLLAESTKYDENSLNVLVHGDAWINNLMYHFDENGKAKDVRFVDFQLGFYGSFAIDFYHFMMTSWQTDIKINKFDEFVEFYGEKLEENLRVLNYNGKIPTIDDLKIELDKRKMFAALETIEALVFPFSEGFISMEDDYLAKLYGNEKVRQVLASIVPWLHERNAFNKKSKS